MRKRGIYKFFWDCGNGGIIEGIFTAYDDEITSLYGEHISFGAVLGKHSDISGYIDIADITLVTDDEQAIEIFDKYNMGCGYNPLWYYDDNNEEHNNE